MINKLRTHMRWIMIIVAAAFVLSSFLMYERGASRGGGGSGDSRGDYAVAEVNGRKLMLSAMYENLRLRMDSMSQSREITSKDFQIVLEGFAMEMQMAQEIRDSGITVSDAEIDRAMKEYIDQVFPTRESFFLHLERRGIKLDDYKRDLAQQLIRQKFMEESIGTVTVGDDEALGFYENMKNFFFRKPSGYRANLARFSSEEEAAMVRGLIAEGTAWGDATSSDVTPLSHVLFITEEPTFYSSAAFDGFLSPMKDLEVGVLSPVFEVASNDFAFGVKSERIDESFTDFDEVSGDIRSLMQQQKERDAVTSFQQGILSRARVVILDHSFFPMPEPDVLPVSEPEVTQ